MQTWYCGADAEKVEPASMALYAAVAADLISGSRLVIRAATSQSPPQLPNYGRAHIAWHLKSHYCRDEVPESDDSSA